MKAITEDYKKPLSFREQQELDKVSQEVADNLFIITLIQGEMTNGAPQWAYLRIPQEKYTAFKAAEQKGNYNTADFGDILAHGEGLFPPEEMKAEMAERYGTDDNFGEALVDMGLKFAEHFEQSAAE